MKSDEDEKKSTSLCGEIKRIWPKIKGQHHIFLYVNIVDKLIEKFFFCEAVGDQYVENSIILTTVEPAARIARRSRHSC